MTLDQTAGNLIADPTQGDTRNLLVGAPVTDTFNTSMQPAASSSGPQDAAADFAAKMNALIAASGGRIRIVSHVRSHEQQQQLWNQALKKYGSPEAARRWVAPPGHSNHERGLAVDLGGDLGLAHKLAPQFGLVAPMAWEDWHFEPVGLRDNPNAYTTAPPGYPNPGDPQAPVSPQQHLAALVHAMHLSPEDQQAVKDQPMTAPAATAPGAPAATGPVAAVTAPAPPAPEPQATSTGQVIASPTSGDTQKILQGEPIQTAPAPTPDQVSAAAGQAGVQGNPSGTGHIASTPDRLNFAHAILSKLGMPLTPENERVMLAWQQGEGTAAAFNPLATTDHAPGSTSFNDNNGTPVQNFTSFEQGVDTTVKTLTNGRYGNILAALQQGNSAVAVAQAIANSPWGTGALVLRILQGG